MTPWILDTDPGIDDALGLFMLLGSPEVSLRGLTTVFGNVSVQKTTRNALQLLELANRADDIWVAQGASVPCVQPPNPPADFVHGTEGLGGISLPSPQVQSASFDAVDAIIQNAQANPGEWVLAPIGPLTNLAAALDREPRIADWVSHVVVMGGTLDAPGNVSSVAEANIWNDPHAANQVLQAPWDVTLVGLDVTSQIQLTLDDFQWCQSDPIGSYLYEAADSYIQFYQSQGFAGCQLHDPAALLALLVPELFVFESTAVRVIESGDQVGRVVRSDTGSKIKVAMSVDIDAVKQQFMVRLRRGLAIEH